MAERVVLFLNDVGFYRGLELSANCEKEVSYLAYERSVGFASLRNSGRSISGILARPLCKGSRIDNKAKHTDFHLFSDRNSHLLALSAVVVKTEGIVKAQ